MKKGEDFRREFPVVDEGFSRAAYIALTDLKEARKGYGMPMPKLAMILVAAVILLSSVAVAATVHRLNIQDFTDRSDKANLTEEARRILANDFPDVIIDNPYADMVVTEAVYDGMAIYILLEITPKKQLQDTFFIPYGLMGDANVTASTYGRSYPRDVSIQDYAAQLGYQHVMGVSFLDRVTAGHFYDSCLNEDGSVSLMWWALVMPEYRHLPELKLEAKVWFEKNGYSLNTLDFDLTLPCAGEVQRVFSRAGENVVFENAGVQVNGLELVRTPMSTYIIINYDILDRKAYSNYFVPKSLRILDEKGDEPLPGAFPLSVRVDKAYLGMVDHPYYLTDRIFDAMPTQLTIGEYDGNREDGWTDGKTYTFHLE